MAIAARMIATAATRQVAPIVFDFHRACSAPQVINQMMTGIVDFPDTSPVGS